LDIALFLLIHSVLQTVVDGSVLGPPVKFEGLVHTLSVRLLVINTVFFPARRCFFFFFAYPQTPPALPRPLGDPPWDFALSSSIFVTESMWASGPPFFSIFFSVSHAAKRRTPGPPWAGRAEGSLFLFGRFCSNGVCPFFPDAPPTLCVGFFVFPHGWFCRVFSLVTFFFMVVIVSAFVCPPKPLSEFPPPWFVFDWVFG